MGLVKHGKYVLARLVHDHKDKSNSLIDIDPDEAQILGLTFEDNTDYESMYLTIEALESGKLYITLTISNNINKLMYSLDNGLTWNTLTRTWRKEINVNAGDKILLKSNFMYMNSIHFTYYQTQQLSFDTDFRCKLYGNILSLNYQDNFYQYDRLIPKNEQEDNYTYIVYGELFKNSKIIDVSNLILPIDVDIHCYDAMFQYCDLLEIPIKSLIVNDSSIKCYDSMFYGCTNLTQTPIIKINNLTDNCLRETFNKCPNISNITLLCKSSIDYKIFDDNIKYIKGTFTKYEGVDLDNLIPVGWTVREISQETGEVVNEYVKHLND